MSDSFIQYINPCLPPWGSGDVGCGNKKRVHTMSREGRHAKRQLSSNLRLVGKTVFMSGTPNTVTGHEPKGQGHSMSAKNGGGEAFMGW